MLPGGPVAWSLFWASAALAFAGAGGLVLAVGRSHQNSDESLSPIAALGSVLVLLVGLVAMFIYLNLWGNLGA